jgi:dihydrofolate synthase/folylpolyglutamate synthase
VAGRTHAVFAVLADKDVAAVAGALASSIDAWHLAGLAEHGPRGADVDSFAGRLAGTAADDGSRHATVVLALAAARANASAGDRILVFGSFHTAAAALRRLAAD